MMSVANSAWNNQSPRLSSELNTCMPGMFMLAKVAGGEKKGKKVEGGRNRRGKQPAPGVEQRAKPLQAGFFYVGKGGGKHQKGGGEEGGYLPPFFALGRKMRGFPAVNAAADLAPR